MMGSGIAFVAVKAGAKVHLIDTTIENAEKGKAHITELVGKLQKRGKITEKEAASMLDRVITGTDFSVLKGSDLVVEAVFEDLAVKEKTLKQIEEAVGSKCIIATNTSTLPINELAKFVTYKKKFHRYSLLLAC